MRHSRFVQSYQYTSPTLEVTNSELMNRVQPQAWTCHTIAQMAVPEFDGAAVPSSCRERSEVAVRVRRSTRGSETKMQVRVLGSSPEIHHIHRANIRRSLERRMQAAKERGDEQLLSALMMELRETVLL